MLVDSHCHLDASEFDDDRAAVVARARRAGVLRQIVPAVDAAGWPRLREICAGETGLFPAYGLHPMYLDAHRPDHLVELRDWIERERPCAIGECGLDFFVEGLDADTQRRYFIAQLELARDLWRLGFLVGLGGPVTYERANRLRRLAASIPLECLLLETDAPDQPDAGIRGQRNEPARLATVLETISTLRDEDPATIAAATTRNAEQLFSL